MQQLFRRFDMARIVFFITFLCLFLIGVTQTPAFAGSSPYSVKGVEVDILDESSVKARNKAFIEAQRKAFEVLATRYYAEGELKTLKIPDDETLSSYIQDFKIASEQLSTKRYKGVFDFRFKAAAVNQHFGRGPINYAEDKAAEAKKVLLLPFYHEEKKPVIFNKTQNPFWGSLLEANADFKNVVLPEGNIQDLTDIGNKSPSYLSPTIIKRLKARYDVGYVVIATANVDLEDQRTIHIDMQDISSGVLVTLSSFDADPKLIAKETLTLADAATKPKKATPMVEDTDGVMDNAGDASAQAVVPESEINPEPFLTGKQRRQMNLSAREQMIAKTLNGEIPPTLANPNRLNQRQGVEEQLQARAQAEAQAMGEEVAVEQGEINVQVYFNSMAEWIKLQKELSRLEGIKGIRIVALKTNQGDTVIEYTDWKKLLLSLKAGGLILSPQSADAYVLKRLSDDF